MTNLTSPQTYSLTYKARPFTQNALRNMHHHEQARHVVEWRQAFGWLCKLQRVPHLEAIHVTVVHHRKDKRSVDIGACMPAAKAAIDSLIDAKVIDDDTPQYVRSITFVAPIVSGFDGLELQLTEAQ